MKVDPKAGDLTLVLRFSAEPADCSVDGPGALKATPRSSAEIARALDHFNVPEREKQEVLAAIVARKDEVVNA